MNLVNIKFKLCVIVELASGRQRTCWVGHHSTCIAISGFHISNKTQINASNLTESPECRSYLMSTAFSGTSGHRSRTPTVARYDFLLVFPSDVVGPSGTVVEL